MLTRHLIVIITSAKEILCLVALACRSVCKHDSWKSFGWSHVGGVHEHLASIRQGGLNIY